MKCFSPHLIGRLLKIYWQLKRLFFHIFMNVGVKYRWYKSCIVGMIADEDVKHI